MCRETTQCWIFKANAYVYANLNGWRVLLRDTRINRLCTIVKSVNNDMILDKYELF
jgi:hypothetical protein